ncbi:MAG TPA: M20/M25/M40 family metallo-hydrolase [Bacteroidia bacterium]|jgi:aminopeptidase YwaD|nr:M20/M25/M40 family metallo-hydrolase [Bacteroidia bacterium]
MGFTARALVVLSVFLLSGINSFAQKDYARKVVDTLASPYMDGRGYVNDGCKKAAKYVYNQFKNIGLLTFGKSYTQEFHFPINTYPKQLELSVNGHIAKDGDDYIVIPITPSIKGNFPVVKFDRTILLDTNRLKEFLRKDYSNTFILIDDSGATDKKEKEVWESTRLNPFKAKGVIILCNKLTEETSDTLGDYTLIYALRKTEFSNAASINLNIKNEFIKDFTSENLIGYVKGSVPDTFIVFSAHYDHLGRMADIYFPGANDNASGVAMLLSLAKYYAQEKNKPKYSIAFIAFGAEEVNIRGSHYYVEHPLFPLSKIRFLVNMDIMGTGDEGLMAVNARIYTSAFHDLVKINDSLHLLKEVKDRGPSANSDHYFFYANHVPDFFVYTLGGIKAYHDIYDRRETLPFTNFNEVFKLLVQFTDDICMHRFLIP